MTSRLVGPIIVLLALLDLLATWFTRVDHGVWRPRHVVGIALVAIGYALWATARWQLGTAFRMRARAEQLVTHGIYRRIRHPIYVFSELVWIGLVIFAGVPLLFLTLAISVPVQWWRARAESRVLEEAFGDRYRRWRAGTWF